jgi:LmbE family N-acetylglucosaminyl deacetylase
MTPLSSSLLSPADQRILVTMAHPDDAEFYCAGTVARLAAEGCEIVYLLATSGNRGCHEPGMDPERLTVLREEEQRRAAQTLGVGEVLFLRHNDGEIEPSLALRAEIVLAMRKFRPDVLITFDPWRRYEIHPDHRNIGFCSLDAISSARMPMAFPEQLIDGLTPHRVKQVYLYSTDQPNHWVDTSAVMEQKLAALRCHVSQMSNPENDTHVRQDDARVGSKHGFAYAEAFHHLALK